jgi:hypothetical protein
MEPCFNASRAADSRSSRLGLNSMRRESAPAIEPRRRLLTRI